MTKQRHRLAVVVPTKDRPAELRRLLDSVRQQSTRPDQIIIVDGGDRTVEGVVADFPDLGIEYVRHYPPSLAKQRNAGMVRLRPDMTLAAYLDDDLVMEPGAFEAMHRFWDRADADVGGARFNIIDEPHPHLLWLKTLFLIDYPRRGVILPSGFQTSICRTDEDFYVQWLSGGATVWRREVVDTIHYDEWFLGTGYLEDIEYSYRVGRRYRLAVVADAKVQHLSPPVRRDRLHLLGLWEAQNRLYFVRKNPKLSPLLLTWGILGNIFLNALRGVYTRNPDYFVRARGNAAGLAAVLRGRIDRTGGHLK